MITIKHLTSGAVQFVESLDGIDLTVWQASGAAVPTDLATTAYRGVAGVITVAPRSMPIMDFLGLWTPDETLAVMQTSDPMMAVAWSQTLASPTINLGDARVIAGIDLAASLGILTAPRAARIRAGLAPA